MEDYYPQLLAQNVVCNAPVVLRSMWFVARRVLPRRFVEKVCLLSPKSNRGDATELLSFMSPEDLPRRYGGDCSAWPVPPLGISTKKAH